MSAIAVRHSKVAHHHLVVLQRITSALGEAITFDDVGSVVTAEIAAALGASRSGLVIDGELIALNGVTTPDDRAAIAAMFEAMPLTWQWGDQITMDFGWIGASSVGVLPLRRANQRVGTLVLGLDARSLTDAHRALAEDLAAELARTIERARAYELVARDRQRAERTSAEKDQLLALLGHELRNPLSPILTATQLMRLRGPDQFVKERATIERNVGTLIRIVDDVLDVSQVVRGKVELAREPVELAEVVAHAAESRAVLLAERDQRLSIDMPHGLVVDADRPRMAQAIGHLIANAAVFSRPGSAIEISARKRGGDVALTVTDQGVGIAHELLPRMFELFVKGAHAPERGKSGLGLGLAIARAIVERHGGTLVAASDGPGKGACFTITLACGQPACEEPVVTTCSGRRILVVDDNEDAAWLLAEALRLRGHDVRVSHEGQDALGLVREWTPEIAFLDIGLPGMDGFELCRELGKLPARPRIVAVTGYGQPSDRERARQAGFDAHFVKPVSLHDVQTAVDALGATHN